MKILFVAMAHSVHTVRWIGQLENAGWEVHLFPATWPCHIHPELQRVTLHGVGLRRPDGLNSSVQVSGTWPLSRGSYKVERIQKMIAPEGPERSKQLADVIRRVRPDIVHSLEMQHAGYLTLAARRSFGDAFPRWMYSCWGNDLYYFGKFKDHEPRIRELLQLSNYFLADCRRDLELATRYGFKGQILGSFPTGGGYDVDTMSGCRVPGSVAARRTIAIKGYQNWAGRALVTLQAIHRCADVLREYEIAIYSASIEVVAVARHMAAMTGLNVTILPLDSSHQEMVQLMARSRLAIANHVTDGTPNAMLEAMIMGALPVQSDTGSTREWIKDGVNGLLTVPEDVASIETAIRRAVSDDVLVERADADNFRIVRENVDRAIVKPRVLAMYEQVARG